MKYTGLFLSLMISTVTYCQPATSVDVFGGVGRSVRSISTRSEDPRVLDHFNVRQRGEGAHTAWRGGVHYNRGLRDGLYVRSGLAVSSFSYRVFLPSVSADPHLYHHGTPGSDLAKAVIRNLRHRDYVLELPVLLRFELGRGRLAPFIEGGLAPSVYLRSRSETVGSDERVEGYRESDTYDLQVQALLSAGLRYRLSPDLEIFGMPRFRYFVREWAEVQIREHPYALGLELGIRRGLK